MRTGKCGVMLCVVALSAWTMVLFNPTAGAATVVDVKAVEAKIIAAQDKIIKGDIESALADIRDVQPKAVTTALAARLDFVTKLAEARMAEKLGDQAKVLASLTDAFQKGQESDQIVSCWQLGLLFAQSAVKANDLSSVANLADFLAKGPEPVMKQFTPCVEIAQLRIATKNAGAAEAELRKAATMAKTDADWSTWAACSDQLATLADSGESPVAGADVFERLRGTVKATAALVKLDIAQGRFLLKRGLLDEIDAVIGRELKKSVSDQDMMSAVSLYYDLAAAYQWAKNISASELYLNKAEELAKKIPVSAAQCTTRGRGLNSLGLHDRAAKVYWEGFQTITDPAQKSMMLAAYCDAAVAAGSGDAALASLQAARAPIDGFIALAKAYQASGNSVAAVRALSTASWMATSGDAKTVQDIATLAEQIKAGAQKTVQDQAAVYESMAKALDSAAVQAESNKDAKAAADYRARAEALRALMKKLSQ
jgi:hypothetical protein